MGDKGDAVGGHETMEGQNTDINPLKISRTQGTEKTADSGLPKRPQVGDGPETQVPPVNPEISLKDLMMESCWTKH